MSMSANKQLLFNYRHPKFDSINYMDQRHTVFSAVYLFLKQNNKILLQKRVNGWMDGFYSLPAGHLDGGETIKQAIIRETFEETGLIVKGNDLEVIHVMHRLADREYIDFFLESKNYQGIPVIKEPDKYSELKWFNLNQLPNNIIPNVKHFLQEISQNKTFSEFNQ